MELERYEGHTPGPWEACHDGSCSCKTVNSEHHPICNVESGKWGDSYPALRITGGSFEQKAEPYLERIEYGEILEKEAEANARLIADIPKILAVAVERGEKIDRCHKMVCRIGDLVDCGLSKVNCAGCESDVAAALQDINDIAIKIATELVGSKKPAPDAVAQTGNLENGESANG